MIIGVIKAVKDLESGLLAKTLMPMIQSVWDKIMSILQTRFNDKQLSTLTNQLIEMTLKIIGHCYASIDFFNNLSDNLINSFINNQGNLSSLEAFGTLSTTLGGVNNDFKAAVLAKQNVICGHIL